MISGSGFRTYCTSQKVRRKQGKEASPSVAILDSQSGRPARWVGKEAMIQQSALKSENSIAVDTLGLLIVLLVHQADIDERQGARYLLNRLLKRIIDFMRLKVFFGDQGYSGQNMQDWVAKTFYHWSCRLEIVKKIHKKTFVALPKRWIV